MSLPDHGAGVVWENEEPSLKDSRGGGLCEEAEGPFLSRGLAENFLSEHDSRSV